MPRQKNFKRLVRSRMAKTGESYTTARSQFVPASTALPRPAADPDAGALARALAPSTVNPLTGAPFTEELLFGLGGGIGFAYLTFAYTGWTSVNLEGRFNALYFEKKGVVETACGRLGLPVRVQQLTTPELAAKRLRQALDATPEVILTVDQARLAGDATPTEVGCYPYPVTVSADGPDLAVTGLPRGRITLGWSELVAARWTQAKKYGGLFRIGPPTDATDVRAALATAIGRTADCLLEPSRTTFDGNFGIPGIHKWARLLTDPRNPKGWPKLFGDPESLAEARSAVVRGLGGAATRPLYAAFLEQAASLLDEPGLIEIADAYGDLGDRWAALVQVADRPDATGADLAAELPDLAAAEEAAAASLRATIGRTTGLAGGGQR